MSTRPRIFVSHSSSDAALTRQVAAALDARSGDHGGFEVLLDVECLQAGRPWPPQLHAMMADADAGLVLLTQSALARPDWVRKEVFILTWRGSLDPSFPAFAVRFPGVTDADLSRTGLDPAQLPALQAILEVEPDAIAARVRASSQATLRSESTYESLVLALVDQLAAVSEDRLTGMAGRLGSERPRWRPEAPDRRRRLLEAIAVQLLAGSLGNYGGLTDLVNELKATSATDEQLRKVLRFVAPYWVPPEDAGRVSALVAGLAANAAALPQRGCAVALEGRHVPRYTAAMYVTRAYPFKFNYHVEPVASTGTGRFEDDYAKQICNVVRERRGWDDMTDDEVVAELRDRPPWLFVILPPYPRSDAPTLARLRARFPRIVFLVWPGTQLDAVPAEIEATRVAVDRARERTTYQDWDDALSALTQPAAAPRRS